MKVIYNKTIFYDELKDIFFLASQKQERVLIKKCNIIGVPKEINSFQALSKDLAPTNAIIKNCKFIGNR